MKALKEEGREKRERPQMQGAGYQEAPNAL